MESTQVLQAPIVTEKSTAQAAQHKYLFWVHPKASKVEVAKAVESAYGVKVTKVNVTKVLAKTRLIGRGRTMQKRAAGKKAVVTIDAKQTLDVNKVITK